MFVHAILEALAFAAFLVLTIAVPGLVWLYADWKRGRGWFRE